MKKYKIILGIDPGKMGAIAAIEGKEVTAHKFPKDLVELPIIVRMYVDKYRIEDIKVLIEHVHSFPTDSRPSAFSFGRNLGQWEGVLSFFELNIETVPPRTWQSFYDIPVIKNKHERKTWLKNKALELFPHLKITLANCDSLLIANYAKENERTDNGKSHKYGKPNRHSISKAGNNGKKSKTIRASGKNNGKQRKSNKGNTTRKARVKFRCCT